MDFSTINDIRWWLAYFLGHPAYVKGRLFAWLSRPIVYLLEPRTINEGLAYTNGTGIAYNIDWWPQVTFKYHISCCTKSFKYSGLFKQYISGRNYCV